MAVSKIRKLASKVLMAGALGLGALGSAQATLVVGVWDPAYGAPFTNLGWRGFITADVPAACLAQPGPLVYPASNPLDLCFPTTIVQAKVEFYDDSTVLKPTIESLYFTSELPAVTAVGVQPPGNILGLETGISSPVTASVTSLAQFLGVFADFTLDLDVSASGPNVVLRWSVDPSVCTNNALPVGDCEGVNQSEAKVLYFVPEPTGVALAGFALMSLALVRLRRRG